MAKRKEKISKEERSRRIRIGMIGDNYIWNTHPEIAELLKNPQDGYEYSYNTHTYLEFICPNCGTTIIKRPRELYSKTGSLICPFCYDGFSYPEKFFKAFLELCGINYIYQYSSKYAKWCCTYRYDFYLPDYNIICETHGIQHYEGQFSHSKLTLKEQQDIDQRKIQLALQNGVKVIEIDCRLSSVDYIKKSILNSELPELFDISNIDWKECAQRANRSIINQICSSWDGDYSGIDSFAKQYGLLPVTVIKYLTEGSYIGLCNFNLDDYKKYIKQIHYKKIGVALQRPIKCIETGEVFESRKAAMEYFGFDIKTRDINKPNRTSHGYHWVYLDQLIKTA